jgi:DNA repair protein RecN (Recombination protein N)
MQVRQHQGFLDRYAILEPQREALAGRVRELRKVRQELAQLLRDEQYLARKIDQLSFQVEEIRAANLKVGEEDELSLERTRLANAEQLSQLSSEVYRMLVEGDGAEQASVTDLLGQTAKLISNLAKVDETWTEQRNAIDQVLYQIEDIAGFVRDYNEEIDFNPSRLQEIEERVNLIFNLKRKYGDTIEEIVQFGQRAEAELETISHSEARIEELREIEEALRREIGQQALALSQARRQAAQILSEEVVTQLADLGMEKAKFEVELKWNETPEGVYVETETGTVTVACDDRGIDQIEFLISPNPGEPLKPLAKVASGGETSRIMLALKTVLASADETPTLIFDEIDQGIGGRVGGVVGQKLWGLATQGDHQVLCVTHLPQIAGYAECHYHVSKLVRDGRTQTQVRVLSGDEQVDELAQMLGAFSESTRQSARDILGEAAAMKVPHN